MTSRHINCQSHQSELPANYSFDNALHMFKQGWCDQVHMVTSTKQIIFTHHCIYPTPPLLLTAHWSGSFDPFCRAIV